MIMKGLVLVQSTIFTMLSNTVILRNTNRPNIYDKTPISLNTMNAHQSKHTIYTRTVKITQVQAHLCKQYFYIEGLGPKLIQ